MTTIRYFICSSPHLRKTSWNCMLRQLNPHDQASKHHSGREGDTQLQKRHTRFLRKGVATRIKWQQNTYHRSFLEIHVSVSISLHPKLVTMQQPAGQPPCIRPEKQRDGHTQISITESRTWWRRLQNLLNNGYISIITLVSSHPNGGVAIFVQNSRVKIFPNSFIYELVTSKHIQLASGTTKDFEVVGLYRVPNSDFHTFENVWNQQLHKLRNYKTVKLG